MSSCASFLCKVGAPTAARVTEQTMGLFYVSQGCQYAYEVPMTLKVYGSFLKKGSQHGHQHIIALIRGTQKGTPKFGKLP